MKLICCSCIDVAWFSCSLASFLSFSYFFFNDTATTEIYTLSLHDALPIWRSRPRHCRLERGDPTRARGRGRPRSEEHTSELQSPDHLVCRLLLEKKKHRVHIDLHVCIVHLSHYQHPDGGRRLISRDIPQKR